MTRRLVPIICALAAVLCRAQADRADAPILYVGSLTSAGTPYTGRADLRFEFYPDATGGDPVGPVLEVAGAPVNDGLIVCELDPSAGAVIRAARFVEVSVRVPAGDGAFVALAPRQPVGDLIASGPRVGGAPGTGRLAGSRSVSAPAPAGPEAPPTGGLPPRPVGGSDVDWIASGNVLYHLTGPVGVGTAFPGTFARFAAFAEVGNAIYGRQWGTASGNAGVVGSSNGASGRGVWGQSTAASGDATGVLGTAVSPDGQGVIGRATSPTGQTIGVLGITDSTQGTAVRGLALASSGQPVAIHGVASAASAWAGWFDGKAYFDGPVAIGTTSPLSKFSINGSMNLTGEIRMFRGTGSDWRINYDPGAGHLFISEFGLGKRVVIKDGSGAVGIGTPTPGANFLLDVAGNIRCNTLTETSTAALKDDVSPIRGALERVDMLRGVRFVWNGRAPDALRGRSDIGFLAEEVAEVLPEVVARDERGRPVGVRYTHVVPLAVEAIRDLKRECEDLRQRNEALESRVQALERAVEALVAR